MLCGGIFHFGGVRGFVLNCTFPPAFRAYLICVSQLLFALTNSQIENLKKKIYLDLYFKDFKLWSGGFIVSEHV